MSKQEFDEFAKDYDEILVNSMPPGMAESAYFAEYKIKLIRRQFAGELPIRILDFGCGAGRSLDYIGEFFPGAEIWGFDVSEDSLKEAAVRKPTAKLISDMAEVAGHEFDLIIAANVFHHIPQADRADAVQRCARVLKLSGAMYIFEHNPLNPVTRWIFERCPFDVDAIMLPRREVTALAQRAQLAVAGYGYTLFFPAQLAFLRIVEKFLSWLPLGAQYYVRLQRLV